MPSIPIGGIVAAGGIARQNLSSRVAYQYCTGPVDVFATTDSTKGYDNTGQTSTSPSNVFYLGTCEQYPVVMHGENWNPLFANETGNMEPFDYEKMSEWKIVSMDLNKFIQSAINQLHTPGSRLMSNLGKLQQGNGFYFQLVLRFTNFGQPIAPADMPPGEYYPCCRVIGLSYPRLGTKDRVMNLVVRTTPLLNLVSNSTGSGSSNSVGSGPRTSGTMSGSLVSTPANVSTQLIYATPDWIATLPKVA